jgi:RNA polymerase sigma-70 factor (ECF subfamily)
MTLALVENGLERPEPTQAPPGELDVETLRAAQRGDRAALERFVRHYQTPVFAFLSRLTGRGAHVDDLAQEVFLRAYKALPRYELRSEARLSTWLLSIAFRLVQDERKRRRLPLAPWVEEDSPGSLPSPDKVPEQRELARAFERAAAELPEEQLATFLLTELHGLDTAEVARATNTAQSTVKTRLFRARTRLRELLRAIWEET